ncbi:hypothetical protein CHUAL_000877 [Chamberlinius hualienensis]
MELPVGIARKSRETIYVHEQCVGHMTKSSIRHTRSAEPIGVVAHPLDRRLWSSNISRNKRKMRNPPIQNYIYSYNLRKSSCPLNSNAAELNKQSISVTGKLDKQTKHVVCNVGTVSTNKYIPFKRPREAFKNVVLNKSGSCKKRTSTK